MQRLPSIKTRNVEYTVIAVTPRELLGFPSCLDCEFKKEERLPLEEEACEKFKALFFGE